MPASWLDPPRVIFTFAVVDRHAATILPSPAETFKGLSLGVLGYLSALLLLVVLFKKQNFAYQPLPCHPLPTLSTRSRRVRSPRYVLPGPPPYLSPQAYRISGGGFGSPTIRRPKPQLSGHHPERTAET